MVLSCSKASHEQPVNCSMVITLLSHVLSSENTFQVDVNMNKCVVVKIIKYLSETLTVRKVYRFQFVSSVMNNDEIRFR